MTDSRNFSTYLQGFLKYFAVIQSDDSKTVKMVQTGDSTAPKRQKFGENLRITVGASQGGRRYMEDRCVVHTERDDAGQLLWTFVGVFDGHGGEHASEYVRRNLLMNIMRVQKFQSDDDDDILEAIRTGFLVTHEEMREVYESWPYTASGYPSTAGTTVSCVFIRNGKLYTGHVGDSAIFLGSVQNGDLAAIPLTIDHKPESPHEQLRIARAGGETAVKSGVTRVVWKRPQKGHQNGPILRNTPYETIPFLSVARSLGDLWSFNESTNMFVVSPEPDLGVHELTGNDFCIVLASDGMTNVLSGEQAVSIVFKEEDLVEANEEINRNHSRCVLKTALQKWRSLRADNVTVATVIFDIDPIEYTDNEVLMKLGRYISCSQALSDRQDAMLKVSATDNVLLATQRTPVIYNGSKDVNFCRVMYRGPGFRTHEEEMIEERRHVMTKFAHTQSIIAIAPPLPGTVRRASGVIGSPGGASGASGSGSGASGDDENIEYDDDEEEEGARPATEIELSVRFNEDKKTLTILPSPQRPPRPHAPQPVFADDSIFDPTTVKLEEVDSFATNSEASATSSASSTNNGEILDIQQLQKQPTPARTPPGHTVRRVKAEAVRRLRTPKIPATPDESERRITRSVSRASAPTSPNSSSGASNGSSGSSGSSGTTSEFKTPSPRKPMTNQLTPQMRRHYASIAVTERCFGLEECPIGMTTPIGIANPLVVSATEGSARMTMSRKRGRTDSSGSTGSFVSSSTTAITSCSTSTTRVSSNIAVLQQRTVMTTGVTPMISSISLQDQYLLGTTPRSDPGTPKGTKSVSKWSLSKLDEQKKEMEKAEKADADGIIRVSEIADEEEDEDVMREPPSKIRRFYGYMRKFIWGK